MVNIGTALTELVPERVGARAAAASASVPSGGSRVPLACVVLTRWEEALPAELRTNRCSTWNTG